MAVTESSLQSSRVEFGVITDVNSIDNVADVRTESSEVFHYNIPLLSPAQDQASSAGFRFLPKVGSTCLVLTTGDNRKCVLGFLSTDEQGSYSNGFPEGIEGDIDIFGVDGNFLRLRSGGICQIGSKAICNTIYIPTRNLIHNISENFIIDTLAGSLEFKTGRPEDSDDGGSKTSLNIAVKEYTDDTKELININMGGTDVAFSLIIKDSGNSNNEVINIKMAKDGSVNINSNNTFSLDSKKDININSDQSCTMSGDDIDLTATTNLTTKASTTSITSTGNTSISGSVVMLKGDINMLNKNAKYPVIRLSPDFSAFIAAVAALGVPAPTMHFDPTSLA